MDTQQRQNNQPERQPPHKSSVSPDCVAKQDHGLARQADPLPNQFGPASVAPPGVPCDAEADRDADHDIQEKVASTLKIHHRPNLKVSNTIQSEQSQNQGELDSGSTVVGTLPSSLQEPNGPTPI